MTSNVFTTEFSKGVDLIFTHNFMFPHIKEVLFVFQEDISLRTAQDVLPVRQSN